MTANGPRARALAAYAAVAAVSIVAAVIMLELWSVDLRVPFDYGGDALFHGMVVKSVVDHGWYLRNPNLGAPGQLALYDFPVSEFLPLACIRVMALFTDDWALLFNLYFLLGFPLVALSAMAVFRHYRVGFTPALIASVLYAFLPSRLLKGEDHLFLDVFYQVPLAIVLMLWVAGPKPPLLRDGAPGLWPRLSLRNRRSLATLAIVVLVACTSGYYAFFAACLILAAGLWGSLQRRSLTNLTVGLVLCASIGAGLVANNLPTLLYQRRMGTNPEVALRFASEAEVYGMKIAQLVLPAANHRLELLKNLNLQYARNAPLVGENRTTTLGVFGVVGFLVLLGRLTLSRRTATPGKRDELWQVLSTLNLVALLVATIGGFGALIALAAPQIRTYSRMNVFIGFFALFAVALLLERLQQRWHRLVPRLAPVLLALGLLDQTPLGTVRAYGATGTEYKGDAAFVHQIETTLPPRAMMFELPYVSFPESGPVNATQSYDLLRPALHSRQLRWSFPTMRGRDGDVWASETARQQPGEMLSNLAEVGFSGIILDRAGYPENPSALETTLGKILDAPPLQSRSTRFAFFDLRNFAARLPAAGDGADTALQRELAIHPLVVKWTNGCTGSENAGTRLFHWCDHSGEISISNETSIARRVSIKFTAVAANAPAHLSAEGEQGAAQTLDLVAGGTAFSRELDVPPGPRRALRFRCDGAPANVPSDVRTLVWRADYPVIREVTSAPRAP